MGNDDNDGSDAPDWSMVEGFRTGGDRRPHECSIYCEDLGGCRNCCADLGEPSDEEGTHGPCAGCPDCPVFVTPPPRKKGDEGLVVEAA